MGVALVGWLASKVDEPRRAMNNQPMNTLEAGNSRLQAWRVLTEKHKNSFNGCDNLKYKAFML
jgi:hypothetical protein